MKTRHLTKEGKQFIVRPMKPRDFNEIAGIFKETITKPPWNKPEYSDPEKVREHLTEINEYENKITLVAELNGAVVGFASGHDLQSLIEKKRATVEHYLLPKNTFTLYTLLVHPDHQNKGIGTTLTKIREDYAKQKKYENLTVSTINDIRAKIAEKNGYKLQYKKDYNGKNARCYLKQIK